MKNKIKGGKGDNADINTFDPLEFRAGVAVEMEHTHDLSIAQEIAADHLTEDPEYYKKLRDAQLIDEPQALHLLKSESLSKRHQRLIESFRDDMEGHYSQNPGKPRFTHKEFLANLPQVNRAPRELTQRMFPPETYQEIIPKLVRHLHKDEIEWLRRNPHFLREAHRHLTQTDDLRGDSLISVLIDYIEAYKESFPTMVPHADLHF